MTLQRLLNIAIGALTVLVIAATVQLAIMYFGSDESMAQDHVARSHPPVEGLDYMHDADCMACHPNLP